MSPESQPPFPVKTHDHGEPIPDLAKMPEEEWIAALERLSREGRALAIDLARAHVDPAALGQLLLDLPRSTRGSARESAATAGAGLRDLSSPPLDGVARRRDRRQINFRITEEQHDELCDAARELSLRPAQLARMLTLNGVRRILYDSRADVTR